MNLEAELLHAYAEWRRLAGTEGEAIVGKNWTLLATTQMALEQLQPRIAALTESLKRAWAESGADLFTQGRKFRAIVDGLIELQQRNRALLEGAREHAGVQAGQLDQATHNLRRLQRSYVFTRPAAWNSFS